SDAAVGAAKAHILEGAAMVPQFDGVNASTFKLDTIAQRMQAYRASTDGVDVVGNIQSMAFPSIKVGQRALDVTWESQGHQFDTRLVYDENGVVYDNMLSNLAIIEPGDAGAEKVSGPPAPTTEPTQRTGMTPSFTGSFTARAVDVTIKWIWGSTRGKVVIDHYVITCNSWVSFCNDGYSLNDWMTLGHTNAQAHRNFFRSSPRLSKLAWGYAWGTPTVS